MNTDVSLKQKSQSNTEPFILIVLIPIKTPYSHTSSHTLADHFNQIQQGSGIDLIKFSSNIYHLFASLREVFAENISFIDQFNFTLWLFKVLEIVRKCPFYKFLLSSGTPSFK